MMIREYFRLDNMNGYSDAQLAELNSRLEGDYAEIGDDDDGSILRTIAEQVLFGFNP